MPCGGLSRVRTVYLVQYQTGACQRMAWSTVGGVASRRCRWRLPWAGEREAQAPAPRTCRAGVGPVVLAPCGRRAPEASAAGMRSKHCSRSLRRSTRVRSPMCATRVTATEPCMPRRACSASTTGLRRHDFTSAWSACSHVSGLRAVLDARPSRRAARQATHGTPEAPYKQKRTHCQIVGSELKGCTASRGVHFGCCRPVRGSVK
jgi:hypothetical protein